MLETRGGAGKRKRFGWSYDLVQMRIVIRKPAAGEHEFLVREIQNILEHLRAAFSDRFFPLANDVRKLHDGSERLGLGSTGIPEPTDWRASYAILDLFAARSARTAAR